MKNFRRYVIPLLYLLLCIETIYAQKHDAYPSMPSAAGFTDECPLSCSSLSQPVGNDTAPEWIRQLHLRSNVAAWSLGIANVGAEIDLANHWSLHLPIYYSAWDYFKSTLKFRTLAIQPGLRYWPLGQVERWFLEAHVGMAYYNIAYNGDYRYQDHNRKTPALGGGLSVGYRLPLSKDHRWQVEFALGAGGYALHYDTFYNTKKSQEGLLVESVRKTYWGIDQVAISFSYTWDLIKKGGGR